MTPLTRRCAAVVALAATAALTACSTPLSTGPPPTTIAPPTTTTIVGASTPALTLGSTYRSQLTYLMVEHVYLLARTLGDPSGGASDAAAALDANSHDVTDLMSAAQGYGSGFGDVFYPLWVQRIADFRAYAAATAADDPAAKTAAVAALATNAKAVATLVHDTNQYVAVTTATNPATGLADELGPDNSAVTAFIDARAANDPKTFVDLVTAAERMYHTADFLAAAAGKLDPVQYPGTISGTAANLRASITMLFVESVDLAAAEADAVLGGHDDGPTSAALQANAEELHNAVAVNYADVAAQRFDAVWATYVDQVKAYARARSLADSAAARAAYDQLVAVAPAVGAFFHAQSPSLSADGVAAELAPAITGLQAAIDAGATHGGEVTLLRAAGGRIPPFAADVSEAAALQRPSSYLP